jgi:hypothetical protein
LKTPLRRLIFTFETPPTGVAEDTNADFLAS